jgi:uncharacterized protein
MKLINVKNLYQAEVGTTESFEIDENIQELGLPEELGGHQVTGRLKVMLLDDSVVAAGKFRATLTLICDRCLDSFETEVSFPFEREYFFDRKNQDEEKQYVDKYQNIDITGAMREEIILAVPTQNFCTEKCLGICPTCGVNLNHEACKCNNKKMGIEEKEWQYQRNAKHRLKPSKSVRMTRLRRLT